MKMRTIEECVNDLVCDIENFIGGNITDRQNELLNEILEIHKAEKRPRGKWIRGKYTDDNIRYNDSSYKCSVCGDISGHTHRFCSWCGADMRESEEI